MLAETVDAIWKMVEQAAADDALDPSRGGPGALLARRELVARGTRRLSAVIRRGVESGAFSPRCPAWAVHRLPFATVAAGPHGGEGGARGSAPVTPSRHSSLREGAILGAVVGTGIWAWIATVDAVVGEPFRTFAVLGGVARFTALHFVLCLAYGVVAVSVVHAAAREASLMVGAAFAFFLLEFAFVMLTAILSQGGLGGLAWARIVGGNVVGATLTVLILWRRHPLAQEFRDGTAEGEE